MFLLQMLVSSIDCRKSTLHESRVCTEHLGGDLPAFALLSSFVVAAHLGNANLSICQLGSEHLRATGLTVDALCHSACALLP